MSRATKHSIDPITLEIIFNGLRSITDETYIALMKSAYSTNIKERHDHSTAICDRHGRLVVQAENSLPIHLASITGLMAALLDKYPVDQIQPGDLFVANDPHVAGGTHLPDINMAMPVFADGHIVGFIANIAHHADVGGMAPGSMAGGMAEIYQEGLRIPVVRLFAAGQLQQDLFDLMLLNVRIPEERRGDYHAQIAACRLGERRLGEMLERYHADVLETAFKDITERTHQRMRALIAELPDGTYGFEDVMDDDGLGHVNVKIKVRIEVAGERIIFDFTGSDKQVMGNINLTTNATESAICYAIKALLDPEVPNNVGVLDCFELITEPGTVVDCRFPAPVAARAHTCQRVVDIIIGALAQALPQQAVGASNGANTTAVFCGVDPRSGESYLYLETLGGGFGGRSDRDGTDGIQVHITNTSNLPIEAIEMEYPLRVESYGFVEDSGGAGQYRGGLGLRRVIRPVDHACIFNGAGERFSNQPWGIFGGGNGRCGQFIHVREDGTHTPLAIKPSGIVLTPKEHVIVETPGAGGYGAPDKRTAELIADDRESGKFTDEYLGAHYERP